MSRGKRIIGLAACALFISQAMLFASGASEAPKAGAAATADTRLSDVGFRATGYPIVDKQVTIKAVMQRPSHIKQAFAEMPDMVDLMKKTNVKLEIEELPLAQVVEKVNLMFASRSFPDVFFDVSLQDTVLFDAAQAGDVYPLDELIDKYAPNWKRGLAEDPLLKKKIVSPDGKLYSLPYTRDILNDYGIRDIQMINTDWMKKVGVASIPKTTDELYNTLKAFRKGIDDKVLPANGAPWYFLFHSFVGGEFEIYGAFGMWIKDNSYLSVNDQKKVEFGATNPRIVDVMEYMNKLYKEKLIPDEVFTDVWDTYVSKFRSIPPVNGLQGSYFLEDYHQPFFAALMPVAGPGVAKPIFRSQPIRVEKNEFTVMKKFAYPEVAVRFMDNFADDELSLVMSYGIEKQADGTYKQYTVDGTKPHNFLASLIPARASAKVTWSGAQGTRAKIADQYAAFTWPQVRHFPLVRYTPQEIEQISVLETEIRTYAKTTLAKWIVNGGARTEWNAYVQQLDKLGLPKLMAIYQAAYDRFNK